MNRPSIIPYVVGQWVRGDRFYGRRRHLREILEGPRETLWLLGTRRIGKTSLLRQLEWMTAGSPELGYLPLFWDFQGAEDPAELHLSFNDALLDSEERWSEQGIDLAELDPTDLFASLTRLRRQIRTSGRRLLLLCDEVEELIELHNRDSSLLSKLRRAMQSGEQMRVVLASTIRLWTLAGQQVETSPFLLGFAPPLYLSSLEDTEARSLVRQDHLPPEARPQLASQAVERICDDSSNHPYLLQLVAKRCLESGDLEQAIEEVLADDMVASFFTIDFEMLSSAEQEVLRSLGGSTELHLDTRTEGSATTSSLEGSLLRLGELGFLRKTAPKTYALSNRFFRQWLEQLPESLESEVPSDAAEERLLDNRYALLERIGEGGMGEVFLATDRLLRTPVAIKILRPELSDDPQILERFRREIVLSRDLGHPNVLRVYHLGQDKSTRYLTMQWVDGHDLGKFLADNGAMNEEAVVQIAIKLVSALGAAHSRGVLHRDVKPQNILLDQASEPFLTDFGLARELEDAGITSAGVFLGTPSYVSPEQASARPLDERSDLYSLGLVVFEMATGRRPFETRSAAAVLREQRETPPPDPRSLTPDLSPGLSSIILRCLEKSPDRRFSSATELRQALEALPTPDIPPA